MSFPILTDNRIDMYVLKTYFFLPDKFQYRLKVPITENHCVVEHTCPSHTAPLSSLIKVTAHTLYVYFALK